MVMILLLFLVFLDMVSLFCLLLKQQSFSISAGTPSTSVTMVLVYESLCFGLAFKFTKNDDLRSTSG